MLFGIIGGLGLGLIVVIIWFYKSTIVVRAPKCAYTTFFGKPYRILEPGLTFIMWPMERLHSFVWSKEGEDGNMKRKLRRYISMAESIYDPPAYEVTTRDRIKMSIDVIVYYRIIDLKKVLFDVSDLNMLMKETLYTSVVEKVSSMTMEEASEGKVAIQDHVLETFKENSDSWGIVITRLDIQNVRVPDSLVNSTMKIVMEERQLNADLRRRVATHKAEIENIEMNRAKTRKEIEAKMEEQEQIQEKERSKAEHETYLAKIEADNLLYRKQKEAEGEYTLRAALSKAKIEELEGMSNSDFQPNVVESYIKWNALEKMKNVKYVPQGALDLLATTRIYQSLTQGE